MASLRRHCLQLCSGLHVMYKQRKISSNVLIFCPGRGTEKERKGNNANHALKCLPKQLNLTLGYNKEIVR